MAGTVIPRKGHCLRRIDNAGTDHERLLKRYNLLPNYFGECTLWWGVFLVGLDAPGGCWTVISSLTINLLLLYFSGIPMLEKKYEGDPAFEEYRKRTSPLVLWFPGKTGRGKVP